MCSKRGGPTKEQDEAKVATETTRVYSCAHCIKPSACRERKETSLPKKTYCQLVNSSHCQLARRSSTQTKIDPLASLKFTSNVDTAFLQLPDPLLVRQQAATLASQRAQKASRFFLFFFLQQQLCAIHVSFHWATGSHSCLSAFHFAVVNLNLTRLTPAARGR